MRKRPLLLLAVLLIILGSLPARAQAPARTVLYAFDPSSFPFMSAMLDFYDPSGNFVTGLTTGQVTLVEDEVVIPPSSLQELQPGVQFAVALDAGPAFAFRGSDAVSRLDKVVAVLQNWAAVHDDLLGDDLSLVPNGGTISTHLQSSAFSQALSAYQPVLQTLTPSLDTLSFALDAASEVPPQDGMKRLVLYITSPPDAASIPALQNLTQRAVSMDIRVHVWIVASSDYFSTSGATALKDLSILTGGTYALFSGLETLPDPEVYLTPLRHAYALSWPSAIRTSGSHSLYAQVIQDGAAIVSAPLAFELNVESPNPILVTPPTQVIRQGADPRATDFALFQPTAQEIEAIIEFPDGLPRPLARTALYVDGVLADENTSAPFEYFTWDLSAYDRSGEHLLQVQALDSLGLEKTSLGITVNLTVVQPESGLLAFLARNRTWVVLGAILLAGVALSVGLLVGLKGRRKTRPRGSARRQRLDPLTARVEPARQKRRLLPWSRSPAVKYTDAYLLRLKEDGQPLTAPPIPIPLSGFTFGSDPIRATRVLDDPSISPLHSTLAVEDGAFRLSDEGSVAGTWVNHEMLTSPRLLRHGDFLQFGCVSYRFMLRRPPEPAAPRLLPLKK